MCSGRQLSTEISSKFVMYTQHHFQSHYKTSPMKNSNHNLLMARDMCLKQVENGMRLGTFLSESGWLQDSLKVLVTILNVINTLKLNYNTLIVKLDCLQRLVSFDSDVGKSHHFHVIFNALSLSHCNSQITAYASCILLFH